MSTSRSDPTDPPSEETIHQQAGDRSTQIGKVMGDLKINYAVPAILVIAVVLIAFVQFSGLNASVMLRLIAPSPSVTPTSTSTPVPSLTPVPTATISLTKVPLAVSPIPCGTCGNVYSAVASPVPTQELKPATVLALRQFALDTTVSSFTFSSGDNTYEADFRKGDWMRTQGCQPGVDGYLARIKAYMQDVAQKTGHPEFLPYIQTEEQIKRFAMERPEMAGKLLPTASEWKTMSPPDYEAMSQWALDCIGIPWPAWNITMENTSDQQQLITEVVYRTYEISYVLGGEFGPLSPDVSYVHQIDWIKGDQAVQLVPPFAIAPRSSGSFELQLTTAYPDYGRQWNMQIFFVIDAERGAVSSPVFNLIMSGLPVPGGGFK